MYRCGSSFFAGRLLCSLIPLICHLLGASPVSGQDSVIVSWNNNIDPDLAGYKVYYGKAPRRYQYMQDVGLSTELLIPFLPDSGRFYFAVTAYDTKGNESGYSQEVFIGNETDQTILFSLKSNFPNPFNPETTIPFYLPRKVHIKLVIYDILGRQVKLLEEGEKLAGEHHVLWDGTNDLGLQVANGIYLCRMIVGHFCKTRKLTLMR